MKKQNDIIKKKKQNIKELLQTQKYTKVTIWGQKPVENQDNVREYKLKMKSYLVCIDFPFDKL